MMWHASDSLDLEDAVPQGLRKGMMELSAAFRIAVIIMYSSQKTLPIRLTLPVS